MKALEKRVGKLETDMTELEDAKMHRKDPTSLLDEVVTITWTDGCRVQVRTETENVAVRMWWRDGVESDWEIFESEISLARVATYMPNAYFT